MMSTQRSGVGNLGRLRAAPHAGWIGIALLVAGVTGCQSNDSVQLQQSRISGPESSLSLSPSRAVWSPGDGVERVLAEFPLPGSTQGEPMYLLYLRIAVREPGEPITDIGIRPIRGFLIQTRDRYQGREDVNGGKLALNGHATGAKAARRLDIDLTCEFGSRLTGSIKARRDDAVIEAFETRRRAGDVTELINMPAVTETASGGSP